MDFTSQGAFQMNEVYGGSLGHDTARPTSKGRYCELAAGRGCYPALYPDDVTAILGIDDEQLWIFEQLGKLPRLDSDWYYRRFHVLDVRRLALELLDKRIRLRCASLSFERDPLSGIEETRHDWI